MKADPVFRPCLQVVQNFAVCCNQREIELLYSVMDRSENERLKKTELLTSKQTYETEGKRDSEPLNPDLPSHTDLPTNNLQQPVPQVGKNPDFLSRGEAAAVLGISPSEFRRRELLGFYEATSVDKNGWHLYSLDYLATLPGFDGKKEDRRGRMKASDKAAKMKDAFVKNETRKFTAQSSFYEPATAAQIFDELDKGMSSRDIVRKLLIHPDIMKAVYKAWIELATLEGGGMVISTKTMNAIANLPLLGDWPAANEEQLLANMHEISQSTPMCPKCTKRPSRICMTCAEPEEIQLPTMPTPKKLGRPPKST